MKIPVLGMDSWKPIKGFHGYEVSSSGEVRSFRSPNGRGPLLAQPRSLKQSKAKGKVYFRVGLNRDGKTHYIPVHVLVAETFHGPRPDGLQVRHLDGDHENNEASNLRWGTVQENADDRVAHGTQVRGETVGLAKLTKDQAQLIKDHRPHWKRGDGRKFARKFGVSDSTISAVKLGGTW